MNGKKVFAEAVRSMLSILHTACKEAGLDLSDLSWVVPHQANGRIIEAIASRLPLDAARIVNAIGDCGNTSSTSIPLGLEYIDDRIEAGQRIGICAFGGGLTFGAALLES
jgi:3-oxoacyl-[acyl-carrier-protein] synthase III